MNKKAEYMKNNLKDDKFTEMFEYKKSCQKGFGKKWLDENNKAPSELSEKYHTLYRVINQLKDWKKIKNKLKHRSILSQEVYKRASDLAFELQETVDPNDPVS